MRPCLKNFCPPYHRKNTAKRVSQPRACHSSEHQGCPPGPPVTRRLRKSIIPKDHLTLQWKGLNLHSRGWVLKIASFEGSGSLGINQYISQVPKTHILNPQNWCFVDVSPVPRRYFQVPCLLSWVYQIRSFIYQTLNLWCIYLNIHRIY